MDETLTAESLGTAPGHGLLTGRKVLVVGGGQRTYDQPDPPAGIGRAISVLAAAEGAAVAVADLHREAAEATAGLIGDAVALTVDCADETSLEHGVREAAEALGGLDGLVLNVGVVGGLGFAHTPADTWDQVLAINVRAQFLAIKFALPVLPRGSSIVLTSSIAARKPSVTAIPAYATSKAALGGLAAFAAREAAQAGIRVNVVMPGLIDTALGRLADQVDATRAGTPIPLGRQGTAWEVANAAVFLLAHTSAYITGHTLVVDGGLTEAG
ncbi:SDR family NAD(P)-dependent oxidoreductase [Amycolatopsis anabasis]|uniref:SDR family NAD(P)-dependent oxidoreductase n=1 Tax=Amycolatopsis anabasis TaxID=1840409 RepID=UPI00131CA466|nr:SDR family oxidoreductase [Amycolatopsis anabasis]